jgi:hypothetical protein
MHPTATNGIPAPEPLDVIVDGMRFRNETATLIAYHWQKGAERIFFSNAKRIYLFRTCKGNYFYQEQETPESSEYGNSFGRSRVHLLRKERALDLYSCFDKRFVPLESAFPDSDVA